MEFSIFNFVIGHNRKIPSGLTETHKVDLPFQGGISVVVPYCSCCLYLYFGSAIVLVTYFVNFR